MSRETWTFFGVPIVDGVNTRIANVTLHTTEHASNIGSYLSDLGQLLVGDLSAAEFEADWSGISIGGIRVESRPRYAIEAVRRAGPPPGGIRYETSVRRDG